MPLAPLPFQSLADIALTVVDAAHWPTAVEQLISQLVARLNTDAVLLEKRSHQWVPVAGCEDLVDRDWQRRLIGLQAAKPALVSLLSDPGEDELTAISLTAPSGPELSLVLAGDWTADSSTLKVFALLVSIGLDSLRQRDEHGAVQRRLLAGYAAGKRWSRLGAVDALAQQIVDQTARLVEADRVSLALYDPGAAALTIAATHGYPHAHVRDVVIAPGTWVMGHVFDRATAVFVDDARLFPSSRRDQYDTLAFAVVPLHAGGETIGVLAVTEKRDGQPFGRDAQALLRGISIVAALAIVAAQSKADAERLAYAATVDSVTQLLNRPYFDTRLHQEIARSRREGTTLAVLIGDIDGFKSVNDSFGHQVGDEVLRLVGGIVRSAVRVFDVCARYGGDEFAILMPNGDRTSAAACAERIRQRIAQHQAGQDGAAGPRVTISIGVAVIDKDEDGPALMARADRYLYEAKAGGKNAVRGDTESPLRRSHDAPSETVLMRQDRSSYVLIAGASDERAESCAGIIRPLGIKVSTARGSGAARSMMQHQGPPAVLIIDVSSPQIDVLALIDAVREDQTDIVVWGASRDVAQYAAAQLRGRHARVLSGAAPAAILRTTTEKLLRRHADAGAPASVASVREANKIIDNLVEQTRRHCDAPGVAVYLKAPGDTAFRTSLGWVSDAIPHVPLVLPRAVNHVMESGAAIVLPNLGRPDMLDAVAREAVEDGTRGLVAVPVLSGRDVVGVICIFDLKPLKLTADGVSALVAVGRDAFGSATATANVDDARNTSFRDRSVDCPAQPATTYSAPSGHIDRPPAILERTYGEFAVARELARVRRERRELSVVVFDVAPAAGHTTTLHTADGRLEAVSETLLRAIRQSDLPIRWSKAELLVVLPGLKASEARRVAERIRAALHAGSSHRLAVSGGVAEIETEERFADAVDRARQKVAIAVGRGHNRVM